MVQGIGNNYEYQLQLARQLAAGNSRVNTVPARVTTTVPKNSESIDTAAVVEVAQKYAGNVSSVTPTFEGAQVELPEVKPLNTEVALGFLYGPKFSAAKNYTKNVVASSAYPPANISGQRTVDADSAPNPANINLLEGYQGTGLSFCGANEGYIC